MNENNRFGLINDQLLRFTQLDFSVTLPVSEKGDELDAIIARLNTPGQELRAFKKTNETN
jgi:hypothetical protein